SEGGDKAGKWEKEEAKRCLKQRLNHSESLSVPNGSGTRSLESGVTGGRRVYRCSETGTRGTCMFREAHSTIITSGLTAIRPDSDTRMSVHSGRRKISVRKN